MKPIRVLVVDDSLFMRRLLTDMLSQDSRIHVVGTAPDALVARRMIKKCEPDVVTLDINMPRMSGLDFLERLMRLRPTPVVIFASFGSSGADDALRALSLGAIDVVAKPSTGTCLNWKTLSDELISKVTHASAAQIHRWHRGSQATGSRRTLSGSGPVNDRIVAIGASTGGVQALHYIISSLPPDCPPILIAQHMPQRFTSSFANRLDANSALCVREAEDGMPLMSGCVYIAPGDGNLLLSRKGDHYVCELRDDGGTSIQTPSADILFKSLAERAGSDGMGIVLSGMGRDGTKGLMAVREAGGVTIAQDRATSLIYGMPKSARESGAAMYEVALPKMPNVIVDGAIRSWKISHLELVK